MYLKYKLKDEAKPLKTVHMELRKGFAQSWLLRQDYEFMMTLPGQPPAGPSARSTALGVPRHSCLPWPTWH